MIARNAVFVLAEKDCLLFVLFYPLFPQNIVVIMFAIVFDKGKCILTRRNARIFRTEKVIIKLLQNSAVIYFFIQSLVILFTDIYIFAAKRIEEFRFNVNLIVVLEYLFRRLTHKVCFELFKFFLNAVSDKFFVTRCFHGNRLVFNFRRILAQFRVGNIFSQCLINVVVIPTVIFEKNIQRETLMIPFKKRLYKRFRFFARHILAVKHTVYRYSFFIKSVRNRICVHSVKVTHIFVHDFARAFDNVVPSGQIRFSPFGRNKRFPSGLFNTV